MSRRRERQRPVVLCRARDRTRRCLNRASDRTGLRGAPARADAPRQRESPAVGTACRSSIALRRDAAGDRARTERWPTWQRYPRLAPRATLTPAQTHEHVVAEVAKDRELGCPSLHGLDRAEEPLHMGDQEIEIGGRPEERQGLDVLHAKGLPERALDLASRVVKGGQI